MRKAWKSAEIITAALVAAGVDAAVLLLVLLTPWLVRHAHGTLNDLDRIKVITEERRTVLAVLAAVGVAVTLWYTHQRQQLARERQELDRDANRTDRFPTHRTWVRKSGMS